MTLLAPPTNRRNLLAGAGALAGATLIGGRSAMAQSRASSIIFTGGPILTIDDAMPTAEAVAVRNGVIVAVGCPRPTVRATTSRPCKASPATG